MSQPLGKSPHAPLKPARHLALLLAARGPTSGVELLDGLEARSGGAIRLNAGSLYRLIAQLVDERLLEPFEEIANPSGVGAPRKLYRVTPLGREVLAAEARRQEGLVEMARSLDLLRGEP